MLVLLNFRTILNSIIQVESWNYLSFNRVFKWSNWFGVWLKFERKNTIKIHGRQNLTTTCITITKIEFYSGFYF